MKRILRGILAGGVALFVWHLSGCAAPMPKVDAMVPDMRVASGASLPVYVLAQGGAVSAWEAPKLRSEEFKQALEKALVQSGVFPRVGPDGYSLEANITGLYMPMVALNMTVRMEVAYTLRKQGNVIWQGTIESIHETTVGEAFVGAKRARMANEGAAKDNIEKLIRKLDGVKL